jgi:hypothetical protein
LFGFSHFCSFLHKHNLLFGKRTPLFIELHKETNCTKTQRWCL